MLSWPHVLDWRAAVSGSRTALSDADGELTYAELAAEVDRVAAGLDVRPGEVVPLIARNSVEWVVTMFGLVRAGALPALINWRLAEPEVAALLARIRPRTVLTDASCAHLADGRLLGDLSPGVLPERPALRGPEPCVLLHTSGTTGAPKLVPVPHQTLVGAATYMKLTVPEAVDGARHLGVLPLFHLAGLANMAYALFTGGHLRIEPGFSAAGFVDTLLERRIQLTNLVPAAIRQVVDEVRRRDAKLPDLIEIAYGASPIHPDLLADAVAVLGCRFRQHYATTETGCLPISTLFPEDHERGRLASAGIPSLGWEVRLDEATREIQVRGSMAFPGYWNDPAATAAAVTEDGFYRTGDVGTIDANGYLTIVDRLKDLIVTGGENVSPAEVETVLLRHPGVTDAAVIAIPDERWGETVHAVVSGTVEPADLIAWCRERLAGFKCPTSVELAADLPRNATGKILKAKLRAPHWAGHERGVS